MSDGKAAAKPNASKGSGVPAAGAYSGKVDGRKNSTGKKGRVMTFLFSDESGKLGLCRTKTNAFSVKSAWEEASKRDSLTNCKMVMPLQGLVHRVKGDVLRKPKYEELMALAEKAGFGKIESE